MARVDDYQQSFNLAAEKIREMNFTDMARRAGAMPAEDGSHLTMPYLGRKVRVDREPLAVSALDDGPELPLQEKALVLHYLAGADGSLPSGEWITFREVPSGEFYWSAFVSRAKNPLVGFFGHRPEFLKELAPLVGGQAVEESGDVSVRIQAFPNLPLLLVLWSGDEEFPADGNVLFDKTVQNYLNTEDTALIAGLPIYKMMALARARG